MGLERATAAERLAQHGPNALPETPPLPHWLRFMGQFRSPLIYLLLFALLFDLATWGYDGFGHWPLEAIAIAAVLFLNAGLGALQEFRSERALAQLRALAEPLAWVFRDGQLERRPSRELVPGDIVRVEAGERIQADGLFLHGHGLLVDEGILTGESVPVDKAIGDEALSGTVLVRGQGLLEVTRTGSASAMGRLAVFLGETAVEKTPLERRLALLGKRIALWVGVLAVALAVAGLALEGLGRIEEVVLFAVALAVAAVPESMPAVVTLTLALGVQRMAKRRAIVRRLSAVEALGSVTVICTDKTGTLTGNRLSVRAIEAANAEEALLAIVLANDADAAGVAGDPLELGLLQHASAQGLDVEETRRAHERVAGRPFDSAWKFMRTTVESEGRRRSYFKGAPEVLLQRAELAVEERDRWKKRADEWAEEGYRVLGLAAGEEELEHGLRFLGLVMLWDPPRQEVPAAIKTAQAAGVSVVMVTGDHPGTARAVARAIGMLPGDVLTGAEVERMGGDELCRALASVNVFARVTPEHKLRIVEAFKALDHVVAMTGDGINDAPALKRADVGIAMGQRGSDVTREVADLILLDDNFATIVNAIEEGRNIYENIRKFMRFLFSTNVALVLLVVTGAVLGYLGGLRDTLGAILLPLTAIQLLWINFAGDGPPALALALDQNAGVMSQRPRPASSMLLDPQSLAFIFSTGVVKAIAGAALLFVMPMYGFSGTAARTAVFLFEAMAQIVFVYPARRLEGPVARNLTLDFIVAAGIVVQIMMVLLPGFRELLGLTELPSSVLATVAIAVAATWALAELVNVLSRRRRAVRPNDQPT